MGHVTGLKCRECGTDYPTEPLHVCEMCFGPLEVSYDYDAIAKVVSRETIQAGPKSHWRYADLLPLDGPPTDGLDTGGTPLLKADRHKNKKKKRQSLPLASIFKT